VILEAERLVLRQQMASFLTLLVIGFIAYKIRLLSDSVVDALPALMMRVVLPAMLLGKLPAAGTVEQIMQLSWVFVAICVMFAIHMAFAFMSGKAMRMKGPSFDVHLTVCGLPNSAFVGYPLLFIMFPEDTALFMVPYMIADGVMLFGLAPVLLMPKGAEVKRDWKRILLAPTNIILPIGLAMLFFGIRFPQAVESTLIDIGNMSKGLGLIYIGANIARCGVLQLLKRWQLYFMVLVKMVLVPVCVFWALRFLLPLSDMYLTMVSIMAMLPSMVTICIQAREYDSDAEYAFGGLLVTTLASIVTMPLVMSWFVNWL